MFRRGLAAVVAVGVAVWLYGALFPSAEDRIRRRLAALAEAVSVAPDETNLERMARAAGLGRFVTEDVTIDVGGRVGPVQGRETVVATAARAPVGADGVTIDFLDERIAVAEDGASASVNVTARGTAIDLASGDERLDALELDMTWRLIDDVWRVDAVQAVETIRRPPPR